MRARGLIALLAALLFAPPAAAEPLPPLPAKVAEAFAKIRSDKAAEPDKLSAGKHWVVSNERRLHLFHDTLAGRGGAYLGVGTDQNYVFAGWARPAIVILMDFDQVVVDLHAVYRAFFLTAATPDEFAALWTRERRRDARAAIKHHVSGMQKYRALKIFTAERWRVNRRMRELNKRLGDAGRPFFLTSAEQYRAIVELFRAGRIVAVRGDLRGGRTLKDIAAALELSGVPLRSLYLSNAEMYVGYGKRFRKNIRRLPTDDRSMVLRTLPGRPAGFEYILQTMAHFKRWLESSRTWTVYVMRAMRKGQKLKAGNVHVMGAPPPPKPR